MEYEEKEKRKSIKKEEIKEQIREAVEAGLTELPVVQYAWVECADIPFSERVRTICRQECPRYGTSWSCPPGTGSVEKCRKKCLEYDGAFVFTTAAEVRDAADLEETLATRGAHNEVAAQIRALFGRRLCQTLVLSGDSCAICEECSYPDAPCRFPDRMTPCIEGYGIVVPLLAEKAEIEFVQSANTVIWFGMILYRVQPQT